MKLIILYRRHFLYIVDTEFYRPLCKHFQEKLEGIEKVIQSNDKEAIKEYALNIFSNINCYLPTRHYFQGGLYCFKDNNPNLVLEELSKYLFFILFYFIYKIFIIILFYIIIYFKKSI